MNHRERIVLAENEPIVAMHIEHRLTESGYDMTEQAESYNEMMRILKWQKPNLIILDQALLKHPRDFKTAFSLYNKYHVSIVLIVDWMTDEIRKLLEKMPFLFLLEKPFANEDLDSIVFRALSFNNPMN